MEHHYLFSSLQQKRTLIAVEFGDLENSSNRSYFKIYWLPSSCVCVKNFPTPLQKRNMTSNLSPTLFLTTIDSHYRNLISDKVVRKLIQPIFRLHGLGTTPKGVIIKENLTFQQFFLKWCTRVHFRKTVPLHGDCQKDNLTAESWLNLCW